MNAFVTEFEFLLSELPDDKETAQIFIALRCTHTDPLFSFRL